MDNPDQRTRFVVIRPAGHIQDNEMPSTVDGEWRERSDLTDDSFIELLGPEGNVRAYPTGRTEQDRDGNVGEVYEVPEGAIEDEESQDPD